MSKLKAVNVRELLDAGVHFGHKTSRWNPKMAPYIYGIRDDIHVIDLQQTAALMQMALNVIYETVKKNGKILFVSTKIQASDIIAEYTEKCGQYYVNHRWLGGMLTNWGTISASIKTLDNLEKILENEEEYSVYTKKEILEMTRKKDKLLKSLGGIRHIGTKPNLLVVIDTNKEHLAIQEAVKLGIPIIAIVDTNSNPDNIDHPIPGNDDAIRSIRLYCSLFADAVLAGIEEALAASGVDLGSIATHEEKNTNVKAITKLKPTKKFSKTSELNNQKAAESEFKTALEVTEVATTTK
ncbi:30S ribosomal protein S2 [Candidatus Tisiphia endosymbiont of Ptychoptera albimana]|uniref:30S ribosomal protein S2 n=1 Tax=Candidatus Tisiphia endosymbiont of Ptychoptera albimana TaxID=3066260 RepID=UPI00312C9E2B